MKVICLFLALCLVAGCQSPEADKMMPPGIIDLIDVDAFQVLDIYTRLTGLKLVEDVQVKAIPFGSTHIALTNTKPIAKPQAIKLLEKALREQAGVVISPLDAQSVSVTYNPSLIQAKSKAADTK